MKRILAASLTAIAACLTMSVSAAQTRPDRTEVAFVANAEAGTVALVEVATRSIIGVLDINPARIERKGPGAPNYAQDTDVSPEGRSIYVCAAISAMSPRSICRAAKCCGNAL